MIKIAEIFGPTIQGEGPNTGVKTLFVRVAGCSFRCSWCFGIQPSKFAMPKVIPVNKKMFMGDVKNQNFQKTGINLTDVKTGDELLTYNNNLELVSTTVKNILTRNAEVLEIKISGKRYLVTPEHPFFTLRGLIPANELVVGDEVICLSDSDADVIRNSYIGSYSSDYINEVMALKNKNNRLAVKLSPYFENMYKHYCRVQTNVGEKNGNSSPDSTPHFNYLKKLIKENAVRCALTGASDDLIVHYVDHNPNNDSFSNLIVITRHLHDIIHRRGYNFKKANSDTKHAYKKVLSIKPHKGAVPVINLSCEPYNTYLADGLWVHNCDSKFAWDTKNAKSYTPEELSSELITKCKESGTSNVVLTGGNPCLYNFTEVIRNLHAAGINVDVETQGDLYPEWLSFVDTIVISPKAPSSHQPDVYDKVEQFIESMLSVRDNICTIKIPVFNEEDIAFAKKYAQLTEVYSSRCKLYINVGNDDVKEEGDISPRILAKYRELIDRIMNDKDFNHVYIMPQIHTLVWGNKQGV